MHWPTFLVFCLVAWFWTGAAAPQVVRRRQVITPTWLMGPSSPNSKAAPKVQVNQQNLREVAAWRAIIQKAVDEGTYVVAAPPPQEVIASLGGSNPPPLPQFWTPLPTPAFNFTYLWPRFG